MTAVVVLRLPLDRDLSGFIALLQRLRVPHRVSEEGGEQVLWVPVQERSEQVRFMRVIRRAMMPESCRQASPLCARVSPLSYGAARSRR